MKKMSWAGCLSNIRANREAHKTSVGKPERKGHFDSMSSADERGVKPVKITGPGGPEYGSWPGARIYCTHFCLSL
jgi:hypothetical protein